MNQQTITQIVKSSGVCPGEQVLIHFWGEDVLLFYAHQFAAAVAAAGASPVLLQQSRAANRALFSIADDTAFDERYFSQFERFDAVLDLFAQRPVVLGAVLPAAAMERYRSYMRQLFSKLMKCRRFAQIRLPTPANAEESGLPAEEFIHRMETAYAIDYDRLAQDCTAAKEQAQRYTHAILHTGQHCALHFDLTDRQWQIDAGDGDWPCGEIYIAPQEKHTNGSVYFEELYIEDVGRFERVTIEVEEGRAVRSTDAAVQCWLESLAAQAHENTVVCELGLGFNPGVTALCGYTVLDEKAAGTFHIALGANHMFGGKNNAAIHLDLVGKGQLTYHTAVD